MTIFLLILTVGIAYFFITKAKKKKEEERNVKENSNKSLQFHEKLKSQGFTELGNFFSGNYYTNKLNIQEIIVDTKIKKIAYEKYAYGHSGFESGVIDVKDILEVKLAETTFSDSVTVEQKIRSLVLNIIGKNRSSSFDVYFYFGQVAELSLSKSDNNYQSYYSDAVRAQTLIENLINSKQAESSPRNDVSLSQELNELVSLKDKGLISDDEFSKAKLKLIG